MSSSFERYQKRRLISSYFSVVLSIALVLFLLGTLGLLVLNTKKVADHFREQIAMTVYLKNNAKEVEIKQLQKKLQLSEYTRSVTFVSKEEAAEAHSEEIGEDYIGYLGYNPLQNNIDVRLKAQFVNTNSIDSIAQDLRSKNFVDDVTYDKPLIAELNENIKKIGFWILILSGAFTVIAMLLINSSIRLSIYARRFIIKTMQMVGATKSFIRRPFIWKSVRLGIIGSFVAMAGMGTMLHFLNKTFPQLNIMEDQLIIVGLFAGIFLVGILITWLSTFLATQRFLNLRTDDLYY